MSDGGAKSGGEIVDVAAEKHVHENGAQGSWPRELRELCPT